jgi:acetate kinase
MAAHVLTINSGSSSIKFALFAAGTAPRRILNGQVERIGLPEAKLRASTDDSKTDEVVVAADHKQSVARIIDWLSRHVDVKSIAAIGHRIVHGGQRYIESTRIDDTVLGELKNLVALAPNHLPGEIAAIDAITNRFKDVPQFGCFDTAFHHHMPRVAAILPVPRRYEAAGMRRYGFHGLSYAYLMRELERTAGAAAAKGRIILAHLGAGCSLAAVKNGRCVDTTMAFTPSAGLVMATRTGDLDPGVLIHLLRTENPSADQLETLVNRQSGLVGLSESSSDIRDLLAVEGRDFRAAEALAVFCYQARKWIGAFAAALEGLDTIVFSAGIGENSPVIRARICEGLRHLGVRIDPARNDANQRIISPDDAPVTVRVIRTDEELMIVSEVLRLMEVGTVQRS